MTHVNVRLPLVLGALVASSLGVSGVAEAQRVHFSGGVRWGGGVRVTAGSSWHFARPAWSPTRWHVSGSIYVGPTYRYYPRPYYVYYPAYVPSYYESTTYYPVAPVAAPSTVAVVAPPQRELPRLGIGLFAGGSAVESQTGDSTHESDDLGVLARFRLTTGLILEGELGKMSYDVDGVDNARVDRRLGASLLYEIGAYNRWAPYLLVGLGVQQAEVGGDFTTTQDYGEIGAGLRFAVTEKFHLAFEVRAGSRSTVASDDMITTAPAGSATRVVTPPSASSDESEEYTRARLNAVLYF
jgi:hypothetical protein